MRRRQLSTLGFVLAAGFFASAGRSEEAQDVAFDKVLYHAYQGKWFETLEQLQTQLYLRDSKADPAGDAFWYQAVDANFSVGDFELNYRMDRRAARIIQAALVESSDERFHNHAAYRLARLHFRKGQAHDALRALDRISGDIPDDIGDDVAFLRASIYLALEWSEPAIPVLQKLLKSDEYGAFAAYNLGIAYLQGDLRQSAYDQLDRAGRIKARNDADAAIRDKANLVLGNLLHQEDQYNRAIVYLNRVRLDGPFSNRALLSAGWANMSAGQQDKAILSWGVLAERDATDRNAQEAMLALPYAYSQQGDHSQAAAYYARALNVYVRQLAKLSQSIASIRDGRFLAALLRDEIRADEDWVIRLRSLPDAPETYYLMELLASNSFQSGLDNLLDLADLKRKLSRWSASVAALEDLVAAREDHFNTRLPGIDARFSALDSRLRRRFAQYTTFLEQRATIRAAPGSQPEQRAHLAELDRSLRALDEALTLAQAQLDRFLVARRAASDSYAGYDETLDSLSRETREAMGRVDGLMMRQGQFLEKLALDELGARLQRLESYASKARFGLADSKDRITRQEQQ